MRQNFRPTANSTGIPFLKWPGGKRWLAGVIGEHTPSEFGRYFEPFLGGGAVFFKYKPYPATLSDCNGDLINAYKQVRDNVEEIIDRLQRLKIDKSTFYNVRDSNPRTPTTRAVRLLYLNRTAFNGIYRVNQDGKFNVPFGCKPSTVLCDSQTLRSASSALRNRIIKVADFEDSICAAGLGDLVYIDPPYTVMHNNNGFQRYNDSLFTWDDQIRLSEACRTASQRGVFVIVSNAFHSSVIELYHGFQIKKVHRASNVSGKSIGRGNVDEALILSANLNK